MDSEKLLLPAAVRPEDLSRAIEACRQVGAPCALAGLTLAVLRDWVDLPMPMLPQLVAPATREPVSRTVAAVRRIRRWDLVEVVPGLWGLPWLSVLDGLITLAPDVDDGALHLLLQRLAFDGHLDVAALMRRRRTGLPGSARISRVGGRYLLGLDSPREYEVYNVLRFHDMAPDHLNVAVRTTSGVTVGPFDGYDDNGAAYEVDGAEFHTSEAQLAVDADKSRRAELIGLHVVRFLGPDIAARRPMLEGWWDARSLARESPVLGLDVVHQPGRSCPCGHTPDEPVD